jgi:hypothetical protein
LNTKSFEYPVFFQFLYRYGNIPVTFLLSVYLIPSVIYLDKSLTYLLPVVGILILIYFINKRYLYLYKIVPYKIIADEEKLVCTKFFLTEKERIIFYSEIETLSGGVFGGSLKGLMKVCDGKNKICIGFFNKIKDAKDLERIILSKVKIEVYNKVLDNTGLR